MQDLKVRVKEIKGHCDIMREGDYFIVRGSKLSIPESPYFCYWAIQSVAPMLPAKQRKIDEQGDWVGGMGLLYGFCVLGLSAC